MLVKGAPEYKMSLFIGSQPKGYQSNFDRNTCVLCCEGSDVPCHSLFRCKDLNLERSVYWENLVNEIMLAMSGEASGNLDLMKSQYLPSGLNNHYIHGWQNLYIPKRAACTNETVLSLVAYYLTKMINNSANPCMGSAKKSFENFCTLIACHFFHQNVGRSAWITFVIDQCISDKTRNAPKRHVLISHILMPPTMITKHGMLQ